MTIDTRIPGDAAQIRAAADWLDPTAKTAVDTASGDAQSCFQGSYGHWFSFSGESYRSTLSLLVSAGDEVAGLCADVAEKLRSYAGQLERMEGHFADHRDTASAEGMTVAGHTIHPPVSTVGYCPASEDDPNWPAWERHLERVDVYNEIAEDVGTRWGNLEAWVDEHLTGFIAGVPTTPASDLMGFLADANEELVGLYVDVTERQWKTDITEMQNRALEMRASAAEFQADLRSGNPAVKAAAEAANPRGIKADAGLLEDAAEALKRGGRVLPIVGPLIDAILAGNDIANGESPSSVGVEIVGGIAGGLLVAGGLALAGVTAPVWGTAVLVTAGAVAVGAGAVWAYESLVPQDIRESIDAGLADAWDATTDFAEDAWEGTKDVVGGALDWAFG